MTYPTRHTYSPPVQPAYAWHTETTHTNCMSLQCWYTSILLQKTIHDTAKPWPVVTVLKDTTSTSVSHHQFIMFSQLS